MIERDRSEFIRRAIEALPEKQRVAVLLHKYEEMDYGEIAKILECSESALKSLLFRAYETLRVQLAPLVSPAGGASRRGRKAIMKKCEEVSKAIDRISGSAGEFRGAAARWKSTWPLVARLPPARGRIPQAVGRAG